MINNLTIEQLETIDLLEARRSVGPFINRVDSLTEGQKVFACTMVLKSFCNQSGRSPESVINTVENIINEGTRVYPNEYRALVGYLAGTHG